MFSLILHGLMMLLLVSLVVGIVGGIVRRMLFTKGADEVNPKARSPPGRVV